SPRCSSFPWELVVVCRRKKDAWWWRKPLRPSFFDRVVDVLVGFLQRRPRRLLSFERNRLGALGAVELVVHDVDLHDWWPDMRVRQLLQELLDARVDGLPVGILRRRLDRRQAPAAGLVLHPLEG